MIIRWSKEYRDDLEPVTVTMYCTGPDEPIWVGLKGLIHSMWESPLAYCPTCGGTDCANLKNSAAMCPGPAP